MGCGVRTCAVRESGVGEYATGESPTWCGSGEWDAAGRGRRSRRLFKVIGGAAREPQVDAVYHRAQ